MIKTIILLSAVMAMLICSFASGQGVSVHVKGNGNCGAFCDGTAEKPYPSMEYAIYATSAVGGEIIVHPGVYRGPENTNITITGSGPLTIRSTTRDPADVTFDGRGTLPGFYITQTGPVVMEGIGFKNFRRTTPSIDGRICGGAMVLEGVNATFVRTDFSFSVSDGDGGAICMNSATLAISQSLISHNTAANRGGAFYVKTSYLTPVSTTFSDNYAGSGNNLFCESSDIKISANTNLGGNTADCHSCPTIKNVDNPLKPKNVCSAQFLIITPGGANGTAGADGSSHGAGNRVDLPFYFSFFGLMQQFF